MTKTESFEKMKLKRLKKWANGKKALPFRMIIFPTNRCNLNCVYCRGSLNRKHYDATNELSDSELLKITEWGVRNGVKEWWITGGGEPMVRSEVVVQMINIIKSHSGTHCELMTNGTLFSKDIIKNFVEMGLDKVMISVDGPNQKINDSLRSKGSFKLSVKNTALFKSFKKRLRRVEPIIQVRTTITSLNYDRLDELVALSSRIGADEVSIHPMYVYGDTKERVKKLILNPSQKQNLLKNIKKVEKRAETYGINFFASAVKENFKKRVEIKEKDRNQGFLSSLCFEPWYTILIDSNGRVGPCCPSGAGDKGPNVRDQDLESIWYGDYFTFVRKRILHRNPLPICSNCGVANVTEELRTKLTEFFFQNKI